MIVRPLTAGMHGVDTNTKLTAKTAASLKAAGIDFVYRYVSLPTLSLGDIDAAEKDAILGAGLGLGLVQHCRVANTFRPSAAQGAKDGAAAVAWAARAGISGAALNEPLTIFYDCEGLSNESTVDDVRAYDNAWCAPLEEGLFMPGGYFGYGLPIQLTGQDLYGLRITRYWKSGSHTLEPAVCGWTMAQDPTFNQIVGGVAVDLDAGITRGAGVTSDELGRFPNLLWAA